MLEIGIVPDPEQTPCWSRFKAFLEPAKARGGLDTLLGPHELLWAVFEAGRPIAAATARWIPSERVVEVVLVGGEGFRKWLKPLDDMIGRWARDEGAVALRAYGRSGWARVLGWMVIGREGDFTAYERGLRG
jgi:hypothetical protein